jgi:allantoinase
MPSLRSTRVVLPDGIRPATVRHEGGVVVAVGDDLADDDYGDLVIMPGLVDSHVHVNEPGRSEWEGFTTATVAAAAGGTTTIVDMPLNSIPPTVSVEALGVKREVAVGRTSVDVAFWGGIIPGSEGEIEGLVAEGVCGFKVFLTDSGVPEFPAMALDGLRDLALPVPLLVHAEEDALMSDPGGGSYSDYLKSRPPEAEAAAIRGLATLDSPVHVVHVSSAQGAEAVAAGGLSGETCPHYLLFCDEEVTGPEFKCAPPIRSHEHRDALWDALVDGALQMVVSDHSPAPADLKVGDFATAWGGIASVQLRLQATWTGASERGIGMDRIAEWLGLAPARLAGLDDRKGSIELGKDADFVVFDPDESILVTGADLLHRHPLTPYDGWRLRGLVVETHLGGEVVFDGDNVRVQRGRMLIRK